MAIPDFSQPTKDTLAARSALICNNPNCATLTIGPSDGIGPLALKIGEAAHIAAARPGELRYDKNMTDKQRADISNGIWLCASCHTMVDKNKGADFPADILHRWKENHENLIRSLLHSHRSPLPLLRKFTEEGKLAQDAVDIMEGHGALFVPLHREVPVHVITSFDRLRSGLSSIIKEIRYDANLKQLLKEIRDELRSYMNMTGNYSTHQLSELETARNHIGVLIARLRDDYGCKVSGHLNSILP